MSDEPDRDLLAAEFVLGSLEGAERGEAERLLAADPAFARSVAAWQRPLTPLAAHIAPAAPPAGLWRSIEASIEPPATATIRPFRRRVRFWQATTAGALAIAASLAAFLLLRQPEQVRVALLTPLSGGPPALMATTNRGGELVVRPAISISVPTNKDLQYGHWQMARRSPAHSACCRRRAGRWQYRWRWTPSCWSAWSRREDRRPGSRPGRCFTPDGSRPLNYRAASQQEGHRC